MKVIVNGKIQELPEGSKAADLVHALNMQNDKIAMEVNMEIIPRSQYPNFQLNEGDKVEIVRAIGGGCV